MADRINRRGLIIETAASLFINQGYASTSVRQIADSVGCTEAALYYHFKHGKRGLLQAVVENQAPDFMSALGSCRQAGTLSEFILAYLQNMCGYCQARERHVQWLISEYPNLNADEKSIFHEKHLMFHAELVRLLTPYVKDESEADGLGWMLICASFGYRQIFFTLGLDNLVDFPIDKFSSEMASYLTR